MLSKFTKKHQRGINVTIRYDDRRVYGIIGLMIDYYTIKDADLSNTSRALRSEMKRRGWKAEKYYAGGWESILVIRTDSVELRVSSSIPPTTNVFAKRLADDKLASYAMLENLGVKQPATKPVNSLEDVQEMLAQYDQIVIKPADGAHGNGITTGITNLEDAKVAIEAAKQSSGYLQQVLVQQQLPDGLPEVRVICIDHKFVVAFLRIPAQITGDGVHKISELIDIENQTIRTAPYTSDLAYIDKDAALQYLGERVEIVPSKDEKVRAVASRNIGQGGTVRDISNDLSKDLKNVSELIAKTAELPVVGIDFYGDMVVEINAAPSLYYPTGDAAATKAVTAYVDDLEQL